MSPAIGAKHDIHRHPNAEEWEYVLHGVGIKHIGDETFYMRAGDLAFHPRDTFHGLENGSDTEPLIRVICECVKKTKARETADAAINKIQGLI